MIEFNGYLTGSAQKYFCNQIVKLQQKLLIPVLIIGYPALFLVFYLALDVIIDPISTIIYFILAIGVYMMPKIQTKKEKEKITPRRVYIENDMIISQSNATAESRVIEDVKEVRDYGEFYYFVFPSGKTSYRFVCQKNLLVKGSLDEFETLFAEKIKRM